MSRPTYHQLEALADFLVENPGIAKGLLRSAHGKQETKRKWEEFAFCVNALGGAQKDGKGWAKYWADKKCALKKTCAQHAQSMRRTGGGHADSMSTLTPIDQRLVAVMGGPEFAAGDRNVSVNPFPFTAQTQNSIELDIVVNSLEQHMVVDDNTLPQPPASPIQDAEAVRDHTLPHTPPPSPPRQQNPTQRSLRSSQRPRTRNGRTVLDQDRDRLVAIESQRVEAEILTARAISQAVEQMANTTAALEGLATATRQGAQAIADALNRIADALQRN